MRILIAWELGAELGHVTRLRPIVESILKCEHEVVIAAINVQTAREFFADLEVPIVQAPSLPPPRFQVKVPFTLTHVLFNCGFADQANLEARIHAWLSLFSFVQSDFVLADHGPGALLAARASGLRAAALGTGFECPPPRAPLPNLRPNANPDPLKIEQVERDTLNNINRILLKFGGAPLPFVGAIYSEAEEQFLLTFEELDPYENREQAQYWGTTSWRGGKRPEWPESDGPKIFVYLKPHEDLVGLLDHLHRRNCSAIIHGNQFAAEHSALQTASSLRFEDACLNLDEVAAECDAAIISGGHGAATTFLLAGKPLLIVPTLLEQELTGLRVARCGAGLCAYFHSLPSVLASFDRIVSEEGFRFRAQEFAHKYSSHSPRRCAEQIAASFNRAVFSSNSC